MINIIWICVGQFKIVYLNDVTETSRKAWLLAC